MDQQREGQEGRQPAAQAQGQQRRQGYRLGQATAPAPPAAGWRPGLGGRRCARFGGVGLQGLGDGAQGAAGIDRLDRGTGIARILAQARDQPGGEQRVPAQVVEEIHLGVQRLTGEEFGGGRQQRTQGAAGRSDRRHRSDGQGAGPQLLAIDLAGIQPWHLAEPFEAAGHHVQRQAAGQFGAQQVAAWQRAAIADQEGHQLLHAALFAQHHGHGPDPGLAGQGGFDLAQLDAIAADLHLVIDPAQAVHLPVFVDPRQVTGAIELEIVTAGAPGIGQEFLGGQLRAAQVAIGHAGTGDAEFAHLVARQQRQRLAGIGRHHQQAVVGQRPANGHRLARLQLRQTRRDGGLAGAIGVEQPPLRPAPARHQGLGAHLAAQVDQAQAGDVFRQQRQQGRHHVQHADAIGAQGAGQGLGIGGDLARGQPEGGAHQVADPDLFEGHVEGHRETLVDPIAGFDAEQRILAAQEVADAVLADADALGLAGGAGGVDQVGQVVRRDQAAPAQGFAAAQGDAQRVGGPAVQPGARQQIGEGRPGDHAYRLGVFQAQGHAVGRGFGIAGQPGGAGLGDGQLHHQQLDAARQPEADHAAGPGAGGQQPRGGAVGPGIQFAVAQAALAFEQGGSLRRPRRGGLEQIGEDFIAAQIGADGAFDQTEGEFGKRFHGGQPLGV